MDSRGGHNRQSFNSDFFRKWSHEMAYVLGFLFADGNVTDSLRSSRTQYVQFTNTDKEIIEKIRKVLQSDHKIQIRKPHITKYPGGKVYKNSVTYRIRIGSQELFADVCALGIVPKKSLVAVFPKISSKYLGHFIRGYFDGDGCIYLERNNNRTKESIKRMKVIFTSGSKIFLEGLRNSLQKTRSIENGHIYKGTRAFQLAYMTKESSRLLDFMYENSRDLFLERKFNIFQDYRRIRQMNASALK